MKSWEKQKYEVSLAKDHIFYFNFAAKSEYAEEIEKLESTDWPFKRDESRDRTAFNNKLATALFFELKPSQRGIASVSFAEPGWDETEFYDYSVGDHYQGRLSVRAM